MFLFIRANAIIKSIKLSLTSLYKAKFLTYPTDVPAQCFEVVHREVGRQCQEVSLKLSGNKSLFHVR